MNLIGPGGLLTGLSKDVLETALEADMSDRLGCDKHDLIGRDRGNIPDGTRAKTVITKIGPVEIGVPRDRDGTFEPAPPGRSPHTSRRASETRVSRPPAAGSSTM